MSVPRVGWRDLCARLDRGGMALQAEAALAEGDVVAAGNWYIRMARRYYGSADDLIAAIRPRLEAEADRGDADAKALVGGLFLDFDKEPARALEMFSEAAAGGVPEGMRGLGFLLDSGNAIPQDLTRAADLFRQAAELGDAISAFNLAMAFSQGRGVSINAKNYLLWLRRAADLCLPEACARYAEVLERQRKREEAWSWHLKAAELGSVPAALTVGDGYRDGNPWTAPDVVQAARWYLSTLDRGISDGFRIVVDLTLTMTAEQVREAGVLSGREVEAQMLLDRFFSDG